MQCFLQHVGEEEIALKKIRVPQIESYITKAGKRLSRASLQHDIGALRGFLRFLAIDDRAPAGLATQIDTPRLYQFEKLPRALPWETVRTLLRSIDRTSAMGLRDYAMFLLMATYGLRASEVVAITLDDIHWRQGSLRIRQRKISSPLELPLTNEVSTALVKHLKRTPPPPPYRRIFLRMRAPIGVLKRTVLRGIFSRSVRKSNLSIPFQGPHCLRHSLAVYLLKSGTPLKIIGDVLGHGAVEHPAKGDTVDRAGMQAKANDPARVLIHDDQYPVSPQHCRFAAKEVRAPETVLQVCNEGQPGWPPGVLFRSVVLGENPPNHVFVDGDVESQGNLLSNSRAAPGGIALLRLDNGFNEFSAGSFWAGPPPVLG